MTRPGPLLPIEEVLATNRPPPAGEEIGRFRWLLVPHLNPDGRERNRMHLQLALLDEALRTVARYETGLR